MGGNYGQMNDVDSCRLRDSLLAVLLRYDDRLTHLFDDQCLVLCGVYQECVSLLLFHKSFCVRFVCCFHFVEFCPISAAFVSRGLAFHPYRKKEK